MWCYMGRSSSDRLSQDMYELGPSRRPPRELERAAALLLLGAGAAGTVVSPAVSRSRVAVRDEVVVRGREEKKQLFLETRVIVGWQQLHGM